MGPRVPEPGTEPGTTAIVASNHLQGDLYLERVALVVDDDLQRYALVPSVPALSEEPTQVARLRLAPGEHRLMVQATARRADKQIVTLQTMRLFRVGHEPVLLSADLRTITEPSSSPKLDLQLTIRGGYLAPEVGATGQAPERCAFMAPAKRAVCRMQLELEQATERHDLLRIVCLRDKLKAMQALTHPGEAGRGPGVLDVGADSIADGRVLELERQAKQCAAGGGTL
jgi:hypothetical protein